MCDLTFIYPFCSKAASFLKASQVIKAPWGWAPAWKIQGKTMFLDGPFTKKIMSTFVPVKLATFFILPFDTAVLPILTRLAQLEQNPLGARLGI